MMNGSENQTAVDPNVNVTKEFIFLPYDVLIANIVIYGVIAIFSLFAIAANTLILYFKRNQQTKLRRNVQRQRAFNRFPVVSMYIQSLALSDLLCCVISVPLIMTINFVDIINNDFVCKAVRFSNIFFSLVTMNNLFVIGIERYIAVFHPFKVPSMFLVRRLVVGAWIAGGLIALVPSATFTVQIRDTGPHTYTKICMYDKTVPMYKVMFLGLTFFFYFIPSIILTLTSLRMLVFLRRRRKMTFPNASKDSSPRFYGTKAFLTLILTFVIPYLFYLCFKALDMFFKINLTYTEEAIAGRISAMLAYSNSAVSPTLMLYNMLDLRRDFLGFVRYYLRLPPNDGHPEAAECSKVDNESQQLPKISVNVTIAKDGNNLETAF